MEIDDEFVYGLCPPRSLMRLQAASGKKVSPVGIVAFGLTDRVHRSLEACPKILPFDSPIPQFPIPIEMLGNHISFTFFL